MITKLAASRAVWLPPVALFAIVLVLWQATCSALSLEEFVLPSPAAVARQIAHNFVSLSMNTGITLFEAALGFLIANALAFIVATVFTFSLVAQRSAYPYMVALQSIPIVALAPLITLWFGDGLASKVTMAALITFFPMVVNATVGLRSVDRRALDLMQVLKATRWQVLRKLRIPAALPYVASALKISAPLAVVGAIVAEIAGATSGIGYLILVAAYRVQTSLMFACILFASVAGLVFFALAMAVERAMLARKASGRRRESPAEAVVRLLRTGQIPNPELAEQASMGPGGDRLKALVLEQDANALMRWLESADLEVVGVACVMTSRLISAGRSPELLAHLNSLWRDPDRGRGLGEDFAYGVRRRVLWRLLDDPQVSAETQRDILEFIERNWDQWWRESAKWSAAGGESIVDTMRRRLAGSDRPRKDWIFLVAATADLDKRAVNQLVQDFGDSTEPLMAQVAQRILVNGGFFIKEA